MKKVFLVFALFAAVSFTYAQELTKEEKAALKAQQKAEKQEKKRINAVIDEAGTLIETNAKAAKQKMAEALTNKYTKDLASTWNLAGRIEQKINEGESQKNYLHQPYDTVLFHTSLYNMYDYFMKCDEIDSKPDEKGKTPLKYRATNAEILNQFRQNLIVGGIYYFNKNNNEEAYKYFTRFIDIASAPMLQSYYLQNDSTNNTIAYYACLAGMRMSDYNKVIAYSDLAVKDPENGELALQYTAMAHKEVGDSAKWLESLKLGAELFPENEYFYQDLISYYDAIGNMDVLTGFADDMIKRDPNNSYFWYVKGYIYQRLFQTTQKYSEATPYYEGAIANYKKAIELTPDYVNALNNLALCYCLQAQDYNEEVASVDYKSAQYKKDKEIIKGFYREALPLYLKLRELKPDENNYWVNGLYSCYYTLEMGKELKEIEKLLPKE